jgi:sortase A
MGAGHLENSSLPVGGESTHTVLSGHSGMPNMKAFDELSKLEPGDIFGIEVFGEIYAYEVTSTEVVLPEETDSLQIVQGEDLATLITCTPYGINSHRLLVHGTRTTVSDDFWKESGQSVIEQSMSLRNAPFLIGIAVVIAVLVIIVLRKRKH